MSLVWSFWTWTRKSVFLPQVVGQSWHLNIGFFPRYSQHKWEWCTLELDSLLSQDNKSCCSSSSLLALSFSLLFSIARKSKKEQSNTVKKPWSNDTKKQAKRLFSIAPNITLQTLVHDFFSILFSHIIIALSTIVSIP